MAMRKRSVRSVKEELIKKSREAIFAAVQVYNNPQITFKAETFITLSVIAWTYLMHAYYRDKGIEYRYFKLKGARRRFDRTQRGSYKYWELERCLDCDKCPIDNGTKTNLKFLIGIRHEIEHQMSSQIDEFLSAKLQACAINYDFYITQFFGQKYAVSDDLAISIQFSAITPSQHRGLVSNSRLTRNIQNYISEFEDALTDTELKDNRYAYRVLYTPISVNRKGQADQVIEFIKPDSPMAGKIERILVKETERPKYRPSEIVKQIQQEGFIKFKIGRHTGLWKANDAKKPGKGYGVQISNQWYWYENWLNFVRQHCENAGNRYR